MPLESVGYLQFGCAKLRSQFTLLHANRDKLYLRPIRNLIALIVRGVGRASGIQPGPTGGSLASRGRHGSMLGQVRQNIDHSYRRTGAAGSGVTWPII